MQIVTILGTLFFILAVILGIQSLVYKFTGARWKASPR